LKDPFATASSYDRSLVELVWAKADPIKGNDAELWRRDETGNWINRMDYGKRSQYGWVIIERRGDLTPLNSLDAMNLSSRSDDGGGMGSLFS